MYLIDVVYWYPHFSLHYHITECGPGQAALEMCCQCMKVNYGPVFEPAEIIGQLASVKMALIVASPISKQQLDPLVYAWQVRVVSRASHRVACAPRWVTGSGGCACAMCVSISRVSDLCVIILCRSKQAGNAYLVPTWQRPRLAPVSQWAAKCGALH